MNPATLKMMGYSRAEEMLGKHPAEISAPIQPGGVPASVLAPQHIQTALEKGSTRFEWPGHRRDRTEFPVEVFLTTIEYGGRKMIQAVVNDISERKRAEGELRKALEREKELGQLKSNFVSMVSHEFRTPLGIIMSSAEILRDYFDCLEAGERQDHLDSIQKSTRRMANLMEEVLVLGRLEAQRVEFKPEPVDLLQLCERIIEEVRAATQSASTVRLHVDPEARQAIADERLLAHMFTNLLSNAIKYSAAGNPVDLYVQRENQLEVCTFRDYGIGIPREDRRWLFHPFHRGRNVADRPATGLGLVLVKRCAELHGDSIEVQSELSRGSSFIVRFPAFQPEKQATRQYLAGHALACELSLTPSSAYEEDPDH